MRDGTTCALAVAIVAGVCAGDPARADVADGTVLPVVRYGARAFRFEADDLPAVSTDGTLIAALVTAHGDDDTQADLRGELWILEVATGAVRRRIVADERARSFTGSIAEMNRALRERRWVSLIAAHASQQCPAPLDDLGDVDARDCRLEMKDLEVCPHEPRLLVRRRGRVVHDARHRWPKGSAVDAAWTDEARRLLLVRVGFLRWADDDRRPMAVVRVVRLR